MCFYNKHEWTKKLQVNKPAGRYLLFPFFHMEKRHLCNRITIIIIIIIFKWLFFGTHIPVYPETWESALVGCLSVHIVSINYWGFPWIIYEKLTFARFCSYRSVTFTQGLQVIKMFSFNSMKNCKATFVRIDLFTFDLSNCSHAFWLLYKSLAVCLSANFPLMCCLKLSLWFSSIFILFFAASCFNTSFTSLCLFKSISWPRPPRS